MFAQTHAFNFGWISNWFWHWLEPWRMQCTAMWVMTVCVCVWHGQLTHLRTYNIQHSMLATDEQCRIATNSQRRSTNRWHTRCPCVCAHRLRACIPAEWDKSIRPFVNFPYIHIYGRFSEYQSTTATARCARIHATCDSCAYKLDS